MTADLHGLLDDEVHEHGPGLFAVVLDSGRVVFEGAAGVADLVSGRPIDRGDRFRIGSVTKTFTASLVLLLAADGVLSLEDPVERWLPGLVPSGDQITLDLLLRMRSGLPDYTAYVFGEALDTAALDRYWSPRSIAQGVLASGPVAEPDSTYYYNNTDYLLLGLVVEAATAESVEAQMWQRIFTPLGLHDTTFPTVDPYLRGPHAEGHLRRAATDDYRVFTTMTPSEGYTAGAMISTPLELAHFFDALLTGKLLDMPSLAMMTHCSQRIDDRIARGRGIVKYDFAGQTVFGHHGGVPGYTTLALRSTTGRCLVLYQNGLDLHDLLTSDAPFVQAVFASG